MEEIIFVTHNKGKIESAKKQLENINFKAYEYELEEPRSDDIKYISKYKVMQAYKIVKKPCISLDCGFWIDALDGFPRAFVNFALDTIGINGILKLMENKENRNCRFTECLSYYDGKELHQFMGKHEGTLSEKVLGTDTEKKWSDLWYIYKPYGYDKTLAQMSDEERATREKNITKLKSVNSMSEFAKWYKNIN
jgi:XTP/dITP diphosphohydrolase